MKKLLLPFLLLLGFVVQAQYNNSWIDYNKTYYKFKVAKTGLYRLSQPALAAAGLGAVNADHYSLWRNGKEVRLYTSSVGGPLAPADFLEFYGEANDGKVDTKLYNNATAQLSDKYNLYSDTATYFLTVNTTSANLRYVQQLGVITAPATPDAFFMRDVNLYFKNKVNAGRADFAGELVYSSAYDEGEGWTSNDISPGAGFTHNFSNLNVYTSGATNSLVVRTNLSGNANNFRDIRISFNGDSIAGGSLNRYQAMKYNTSGLSLSRFTNPNTASLNVVAVYPGIPSTDRIVIGELGITFPATFNFNNEKEFSFSLPASAVGNHLLIENFNNGAVPPVLFDMTSGLRINGDITSVPGKVKFLLAASTVARQFVLLNIEAANINSVGSLQSKIFLNLTSVANQANYLIISNPVLYNDGSGVNQVEQYRQYRSSTNGGSYLTKTYDVDELSDQFAFGISKHPSSIRDFILNAFDNWTVKPKDVFLIGRGVSYNNLSLYQSQANYKLLDLVPTFGWPASDMLLASRRGTVGPVIGVGRLSAINGNDIKVYLQKVVEYETVQRTPSCNIVDKAWMKNVMHVVGGKTTFENELFVFYMNNYAAIAQLPFFGGRVETFTKTSSTAVEQANTQRITQLIEEGVSVITYFGHSSASTFEFNLSNPAEYNNQGKYPIFYANGCNAGDFYGYSPSRITGELTLSEKYILTPQRGSVGFIASTHLGIPNNLDPYVTSFYNKFSKTQYGGTVGEHMKTTIEALGGLNSNVDFRTRFHLEQNSFHGDPVLRVNNFAKPDYAIEEPLVKLSPNLITVADNSFDIFIKYKNIGRATTDSIRILVQRQLPDNSTVTIFNQKRLAAYYEDSIKITVTINPLIDKGSNNITVTLDQANEVVELCETNNKITKNFFIFEDELRPIYPYDFQIVNTSSFKYAASTANPLAGMKEFNMELDTTELFNSAFKKTYTLNGTGGLVEFSPSNITYQDSTVYYWRVSIKPAAGAAVIWNNSSFIYLPNSTPGFGQSHYFQHRKSTYTNVVLNANRKFEFLTAPQNITIRTGLFPYFDFDKINVNVGVTQVERYGCRYNSLQFTVFNPATLELWKNQNVSSTNGLYGSETICSGATRNFFEFRFNSTTDRRKAAMDFIDLIPEGMYVGITNLGNENSNNTFIADWQADQSTLGTGNSLYHKLRSIGFTKIDSFTRNIPLLYFYKKGSTNFTPVQVVGAAANSYIDQIIPVISSAVEGAIESPKYGPALRWNEVHWRGTSTDPAPSADQVKLEIYGFTLNGTKTLLATIAPAQDSSLSFVNAQVYPFLQIKVLTKDTVYATPIQLRYLRVNGSLAPEGAIAPNLVFNAPDTVFAGQDYPFSLAFKNVSPVAFDSLIKTKFVITDRNNVPHLINIPARKALVSGDTLIVKYALNTLAYPGANTLFIEFNPDNHQPEQYHFNNVLFKEFFAIADIFNPTLDVTFDAVHILNKDIVSSRPNILIKLKDENRFVALKDTALLKVQVRYPDNSLRTFRFDNDTMRFIPAVIGSGDNTATIEFKPYFSEDGEYELIVSGKDASGNKAGALDYKVQFSVINKPMISNLLNYPNPFTTSTAFVFTLTGNELPQNMRIQVLTVTGKVVREITQNELGPIHIGRNITDFKWDGTDMYGQKLANGVYLYRIITNLNGKSLDQYKATNDNTDKFFNNGYGKMYLMR